MKKVLKGWLIDNAVTTDNKTDKILLLASAGSLTLDDVLEEMYKQDTGLRPETMRHSVHDRSEERRVGKRCVTL